MGPDWRSLVRLRGDLIACLIEKRHRVLCLTPVDQPDGCGSFAGRLEAMGAECERFPLEQDRLRFFADNRAVVALSKTLTDRRIQVVLGYRPKTMLIAALAGRHADIPRIVTLVSTLGPELGGAERPGWHWRRLTQAAFAASHSILFHNDADLQRLGALDLLPKQTAAQVIPGAGVDLERHLPQPLPPVTHGLTFLMLAPRQREKGVFAFCAAARLVRDWHPDARFLLAGPEGTGPGAINGGELADYAGSVELLDEQDDVRRLFTKAHVVVLPSIREGMSRTLLEALANARPIITTDVPGCRETVDELVNGIIVPPQDADALALAMRHLIDSRSLLKQMAQASRLKAERLFDVRQVNAALLAAMGLA